MIKYINKQKALIRKMKSFFDDPQNQDKDIQSNFLDPEDKRLCLTLLAFVPKFLGQKIVQKIIDPLKEIEPEHYYYPLESLHTTIQNVRIIHDPPNFTEEDIKKVDQLCSQIIPQYPIADYSFEGLIQFPKSISLIGYHNKKQAELINQLDQGLKDIGLPDDKQYFSKQVFLSKITISNMTVCRFLHKPGSDFLKKVKELEDFKLGTMRVQDINLVVCNLVCHPKSRKIIASYQLKSI